MIAMPEAAGADLPASARRVQEALAAASCQSRVRAMPGSTRTAEEAAAACDCPVGAIVKSLVFRGAASVAAILVLTSGTNRVHENRLGRQLGETLGRADADFVHAETGYAIGGVPPLGHARPLRTVMDRDLLGHETVWAAAGTPFAVFPIAPDLLARLTAAEVLDVT